tara:strand:+ start:971 stop:2041 length:1071 start_codon:yes stop_codon:yes gene_type:complete
MQFEYPGKVNITSTPINPPPPIETPTALVVYRNKNKISNLTRKISKALNNNEITNQTANVLMGMLENKPNKISEILRRARMKTPQNVISRGGVRKQTRFTVTVNNIKYTLDFDDFVPVTTAEGVVSLLIKRDLEDTRYPFILVDLAKGSTSGGEPITIMNPIASGLTGIDFFIKRLTKIITDVMEKYNKYKLNKHLDRIIKKYKAPGGGKYNENLISQNIFNSSNLEELKDRLGPALFKDLVQPQRAIYSLFYTSDVKPFLTKTTREVTERLSRAQLDIFKKKIAGEAITPGEKLNIATLDLLLQLKKIDGRTSSGAQTRPTPVAVNVGRVISTQVVSANINQNNSSSNNDNTAGT